MPSLMDELCVHLMMELVVYCVLPFIYANAEAAITGGDSAAMKAMWREDVRASKCAEAAAKQGDLATLKWLKEKNPDAVLYSHAMREAAAGGHFKIVKWLYCAGAFCSTDVMDAAAGSGNIKMVKWLGNRGEMCTVEAMDNAIKNNRFEMAKWLHENRDEGCSNKVGEFSTYEGNLDLVKWVRDNYRNIFCEWMAMECAIEGGYVHIAKWLWEHRNRYLSTDDYSYSAMCSYNLDMIKWAHDEMGLEFSRLSIDRLLEDGNDEIVKYVCENMKERLCIRTALISAAVGGHFELVKWVYEKHRTEYEDKDGHQDYHVDSVVSSGNLEMIEWFYERREIFHEYSDPIQQAAENGHLDSIKWLFSIGYNQSEQAINTASENGHLDIVICLISNGFVADKHDINIAAANGHLDIVEYLANLGLKCSQYALDNAIKNGFLSVVQWLYENCKKLKFKNASNKAAENGRLSVLAWLEENKVARCTNEGMVKAVKNGKLDVVLWLINNRRCENVKELISACSNEKNQNVIAYLSK